jgi:hypothetical protein
MTDTPPTTYLTLGQAVKAVDVSRSTLQRRLKLGEVEGAHRTASGDWAIPFSGLISAGLTPRVTPADSAPEVDLTAEVERLRSENAHLRLLADERLSTVKVLTDLLEKLPAMLAAAPPQAPTAPAPEPSRATETPPPVSRRRWWRYSR